MAKKNNIIAIVILIVSIAYVLTLGLFGDQIAIFSSSQPLILQLLFYYLTQPAMVIIIVSSGFIGSFIKKIGRSLIAGTLLFLAQDMISTPHCVLFTGFVNSPNINLCSDTIYIRALDTFLPHALSYSLYYWILPIIFVIIAFELYGATKFLKYFKSQR